MSSSPSTDALDIKEVGPYNGAFQQTCDAICQKGIRIWSYPFDNLLCCFITTTRQKKRPLGPFLYRLWALPFWAACCLAALPIGVVFMLLYIYVSRYRKPYRYSFVRTAPLELTESPVKSTYTCVTSNVCIMHEVLTRFNNQHDTFQKARTLGRTLVLQQSGEEREFMRISQRGLSDAEIYRLRDEKLVNIGAHQAKILGMNGEEQTTHATNGNVGICYGQDTNKCQKDLALNNNGSTGAIKRDLSQKNECIHYSESNYGPLNNMAIKQEPNSNYRSQSTPKFDVSVLREFPDIDFLCLQETWELTQTKELVKELHKVFPYIAYDARVDSVNSNMYLLNSGLLIASRYPITDIDFDYFRCSKSQCKLASKGLLQVKVSLGQTPDGRSVVGYLYSTHLQAYQGTYPVQQRQMDDIVHWTEDFRLRKHAQNDNIAFDLLTGDFNADNMSQVDCGTQDHNLFDIYEDVCRVKPGQDHSWTVGTEMRHTPLDDALIKTPLGLQLALQHPCLLQHYVLSADINDAIFEIAFDMPPRDHKDGDRLILTPVGGKRRIDFVLYRKGDGVRVLGCNPVTQLAGLTDHIPYCLTFTTKI